MPKRITKATARASITRAINETWAAINALEDLDEDGYELEIAHLKDGVWELEEARKELRR